MTEKSDIHLRVLYNASCPICSREIDHYAKLSDKQSLPVAFDDLNDANALADWGLTRKAAAKRLHIRRDGEMRSGVPAFIAIWREIPQYRWLARIVDLPVIRQIAGVTYDLVLAPLIYGYDRIRVGRQGAATGTCAPRD